MNEGNSKGKHLIICISIFLIIAIIITIFIGFSNKKDNTDLTSITNKLFEKHMGELLNVPEKKNLEAAYNITATKIIAGNSKEFVAEIDYDLTATEASNTETVQFKWTMRIKKSMEGKYTVIEQGANVSTKGLKQIKDSTKTMNKATEKAPLIINPSNKYSIRSNRISVTYDDGKNWTDVPVPMEELLSKDQLTNLANGKKATLEDGSYYISEGRTAFIYGGESGRVKITTTDNKGKSWYASEISNKGLDDFYANEYIGFTSEQQGYVVLTSSVAMGHQENNIYETSDGCKTWHEIGNTNAVYARVVTGAGFATDKIGLVCFRYENDNNPTIYRTTDSGSTWKKVYIKLPSQYSSDYATPLCPVFNGANGLLPVKLRDANKTIQFTTSDYGETWKFDLTPDK
jgi:photosystem II stability/assembly factor-like uncharacterized protein